MGLGEIMKAKKIVLIASGESKAEAIKGLFSGKITTENPASARHIFTILKEHFDIHSKIMVKKSNSLKKNNIYMVLIDAEMGVRDLLQETGIFKEIDGVLTIDYKIDHEMV